MEPATTPTPRSGDPNRFLTILMIPAVIMPLTGWMFSVSLPIIRDEFAIPADLAAWIATAFTLPFMILMPVYGRLSDGLGKRRLLLLGIAIYSVGAGLATASTTLGMLMIGRIVQGLGAASLLPLPLALITEVFPSDKRGYAMGIWSTVGPVTGVIGPILAGFIVAGWGWRASFMPPIFVSAISLVVIYLLIPGSGRPLSWSFLSHFDWVGVILLSATLMSLLFYFSSRPITGRPALQDWRLFVATAVSLALFVAYERRKADPFIKLRILNNRSLVAGSFSACLRMMALGGGMAFLMPLYLADVVQLDPSRSGFYLMANPAAMSLFVRFGGSLSDRWGSRVIAMSGFGVIAAVMLTFSQLPAGVPHWVIVLLLVIFGSGAGLMLAALHRASLNNVPEVDVGTASGIYSMIRFLGSACGAAFGGILLQLYLDRFGSDLLTAYQHVFRWFIGFALLGVVVGSFLPKTE